MVGRVLVRRRAHRGGDGESVCMCFLVLCREGEKWACAQHLSLSLISRAAGNISLLIKGMVDWRARGALTYVVGVSH